MKSLIIVLLLFSNPHPTSSVTQDSLEASKVVKANDTVDYKQLYQVTKEYNNKILNTIYWAIGGIFAAIIGIIGSNIFFNYRFNRKEIENIIQKYDSRFEELKNENLNLIKDRFADFEKESTESLEEIANSNLENYKENISLVKSSFDEKINSVKNIIEKNQEVNDKRLSNLEEIIDSRLKNLDTKVTENIARLWKLEGVNLNALNYYIEAGHKRIKRGEDVKYVLGNISDILQDQDWMLSFDKENLERLLEEVPETDDNNEEVEKINKLMEDIKVN